MLTYIDCCDDIFYLRALCQIHLQTQPKANKVFTLPIISANMATSNVSAADLRSKKSFTSPIWQYFRFKTDEERQRQADVQALPKKGFCCWRKYFQPSTAFPRSSSCECTKARETSLIKLQLSNLTAKDSCNLCNC